MYPSQLGQYQPAYLQQGTYPQQQPQQWQQPAPAPAQDQSWMTSIISAITTLPGLSNAQTIAANLSSELSKLPAPIAVNAQPTATDYNALQKFAVDVRDKVVAVAANEGVAFGTLRQSIVLSLLFSMMGGGGMGGGMGSNPMMLIVLLLVFKGSGSGSIL